MFYDEHNPPHFHATYGEFNAEIGINDLNVLVGKLPSRALGLVVEWASIPNLNYWIIGTELKMVRPLKKLHHLNNY